MREIKLLLLFLLLTVSESSNASRASNLANAVEVTGVRCSFSQFEVTSSTSTRGPTSIQTQSSSGENGAFRGVAATLFCDLPQQSGDAAGWTVSFDWQLDRAPIGPDSSLGDGFRFAAYNYIGISGVRFFVRIKNSTNWTRRTIFVPPGVRHIEWRVDDTNPATIAWLDNIDIQRGNQIGNSRSRSGAFEGNSFSRALDNTGVDFRMGGNRDFFPQTEIVRTGRTALQSGNISDGQASLFFTQMKGGQRVTFDWRVSSEAGFDGLIFGFLDSNGQFTGTVRNISGFTEWESVEETAPENEDVIAVWAYVKDEIVTAGLDAGWVDNVHIYANPLVALTPVIGILLLE